MKTFLCYKGESYEMKPLTKKSRTISVKLSATANDAARAIVKGVEAETGKELSLALCLKIAGVVQVAMDGRKR